MFRKKSKNSGPRKSFLTEGPTLHYSHPNVHRYWWLAVVAYLCACLFWSKIITGNLDALQIENVQNLDIFSLGYLVISPVSIFEYPYQILVLGFLMAILSFTPILMSQLFSSRYSVLLILMAAFIAKLPVLSIFLMVCCIAVASRPLRFRSRFISIVLCCSPLMIYWGIFGGMSDIDPVKWAVSYTPWLVAWLSGLAICAIVLSIGHYTRYKPGAASIISLLMLIITGFIFFDKINFSESDYQIYVVRNNPRECPAFRSRSISPILDKAADDPIGDNDIFLTFPGIFNVEQERNDARNKLLKELEAMMRINVWPLWFMEHSQPEFYDFEGNRNRRIEELNYFISRHPKSRRMPIALYYKALMREYQPDVKSLVQSEVLEFYASYPRQEVFPDWARLYRDYPDSPESLEARNRIIMSLARRGDFETAVSLCRETIAKIEQLKPAILLEQSNSSALFTKPRETVITERRLEDIQFRTKYMLEFIRNNNVVDDQEHRDRLAIFIALDNEDLDYEAQLAWLLRQTSDEDPLKDNILLAMITQITSLAERADALSEFIANNKDNDSIVEAYYELGLCYVYIWRETEANSEQRIQHLAKARESLTLIVSTYPDSPFALQASNILNGLPRAE